MKFLLLIQRLLAAAIDLLIIYLPSLFLILLLFKSQNLGSLVTLLAALLFVIYNMVATSSFSGKTIGKHFARLKVSNASANLLESGQREFAKLLYFLPWAGPLFSVVSLVCYGLTGKFLHDMIGRSEVIVSG